MTQEIPRPSPKDLAIQFVRTIDMIGRPPATPEEEYLEEYTGGGIQIRRFAMGFDDRAVPEAFASQIRRKLHDLLRHSPVTPSYRSHIADMVNGQLESGMMRMMGSGLIINTAGVSLEEGRYGMFDPEQARSAETAALQQAAYMARNTLISELAETNWRQLDDWVEDFRVKYKAEPEI